MHYHALGQADDGKTISLIFHIDIPAASNAAGYPYRTAVKELVGGTNFVSVLPSITTAELVQLQNGERYEIAETLRWSSISPPLSNAQKAAAVTSAYIAMNTAVLAQLQSELMYWGYSGD